MNRLALLVPILAIIIVVSLFIILPTFENSPKLQNLLGDIDKAREKCIETCINATASDQNLSNGPCLSNEIIPDWVCDVAHSPRQTVDNYPENQCSAFREGKARHFVEVNPKCNFIKAF